MTRQPAPEPPQSNESLWKVGDAADYLRLSPKAVYGLVERGELPCVRIGTRIRFIPSALAAWVEGQANDTERKRAAVALGVEPDAVDLAGEEATVVDTPTAAQATTGESG